MTVENDWSDRIELYKRAEVPVREFFATHFDRLCAACGTVAAATDQHVCCCIGVPCVEHLQDSPVLGAMADSNPHNRELVRAHTEAQNMSLLGPKGCLLDWGRPPPCNVCICTAQRKCLLAAMPASQVASLNKSLKAYYIIADPALRNMATVHKAVDVLLDETAKADKAVRAKPAEFSAALDTEIDRLLKFCDQMNVPRPTL